MQKPLTVFLLAAYLSTIGCASNPHRWDAWEGKDRTPEGEATAKILAADSVAFFAAVAAGDNNKALATLWTRSAREPEGDGSAKLAAIAAGLAGVGLIMVASEEIENTNESSAEAAWWFIGATGVASVVLASFSF